MIYVCALGPHTHRGVGRPAALKKYIDVLSPELLHRALWEACRQRAIDVGGDCSAEFVRENVTSLAQLEADAGPFDAVIVAAGAAVGAVSELCEPPSKITESSRRGLVAACAAVSDCLTFARGTCGIAECFCRGKYFPQQSELQF